MALTRRVVLGLGFFLVLASLPLFAARRGDTGSSQNGFFSNCPPTPGGGVCAFVDAKGTAILSGTDASGNAVTVTIALYDFGYFPCTPKSCQPKPLINYALLDVVLTGTDAAGIESLVVKGKLKNPSYISCAGNVGVGCLQGPAPDSNSDIQQPTPIAGADQGTQTNTRWDFGGIPPLNPPLPAIPFDQLYCIPDDGTDNICWGPPPLGEAVLVVANSVAKNKLGTDPANYLVVLTDGTTLGTLAVPASPTKQVANTNNTQATATVITQPLYNDYTDASQAYPQIDAEGNPNYPEGFVLAPVPPPSSPSWPSCYPINGVTGAPDTRTFRTAWYTYTAPSDGSITISTAGSRYDTLLYVFTGSGAQPTTVSCDDDPQSGLLQAVTTFEATQGTAYQIVVYESPTFQTNRPGSLTGYPLSVDGALYFNLQFTTIPPTTKTTVSSSPNPSTFGQAVKFSAKVTSKRPGTPTGTVTFSEGANILGISTLIQGRTQFYGVPLTSGKNRITATYSGDSNFDGSSGSVKQFVDPAGTTLAVSSSQNPSGLGQPVTFTALITPQYGGQASGTVTFYDNGATLGSAPVSGNSASLMTADLKRGVNSITAIYSGDSNFKGSTSEPLPQIVTNATSTVLTSSPNPSILRNPVTFTVTVTSDSGTPKGTVQILKGTMLLTTLTLSSGSAQYVTSQLQLGSNIITAVYNGNLNFAGSTSLPVNQVVVLASNFTILHSFAGGTDGALPDAGLVRDAQGNLYGTTAYGGPECDSNVACGTVFKVDTSGQETVLYTFTGTGGDGAFPEAGLTRDAQGNLYGTTKYGGDPACYFGSGCGTVFKLDTSGHETVLYSFTKTGGDGQLPFSGLALDAQGNLYGTTAYGGSGGVGTVFKLDTNGHETVLYSFTGAGGDGAYPEGGLALDTQGNLYGTTNNGGSSGAGTVFKVDATGHETVLYSFTGTGEDGRNPNGDLVLDTQGNLYGTTAYGGLAYCGTVFKVDPSGHETVLYSFNGTGDGRLPVSGLVLDAQGNLYGTTLAGDFQGIARGTVFKVDATGHETVLYTFSGGDGDGPRGSLVRDAQGNLYGVTDGGGANGLGTVFKLAPQ